MRVFDVFEATRAVPVGGAVQDALLMVMECVTGGDLFDYIVELRRVRRYMREEDARLRAPPSLTPRSLFRCVVFAIGALHGAHVAHRDIKPENIMLVRDPITNEISFDTVRLIDFGWAKTIHPLVDSHTTEVGSCISPTDNTFTYQPIFERFFNSDAPTSFITESSFSP